MGELMKKAREKAGLSNREVAVRLKCCRATIVNWESENSSPRLVDFVDWCSVVGVSPQDILNAAVKK